MTYRNANADSAERPIVMLLDNHHGPDRRVDMEVEMLSEAGMPVRVVAWDRRPPEARAGEAAGQWPGAPVDLIRVPVPAPAVGGLRSIARVASYGARVWRRRRELLAGARVVVAHDLYLLPVGWLLSVAARVPLVYDAHEEFAAMEGSRYPGWVLALVTQVETLLARRAALVVVPGETRAARWEAVGIEPLVLPNLGRRAERMEAPPAAYDVAYCGGLSEKRRLDLLVELARSRPDLRIAVAGEGRAQDWLAEAAAELPNLEFEGETSTPDEFLARARAVYYGLDPEHSYAPKSCPNTLYQAVRVGRPLIHLGGGEIERFNERFRVGLRIAPGADALADALDRLPDLEPSWQFDAAWKRLEDDRAAGRYADAVARVARSGSP
jgi:hypothetical protein